ncbi:MAG TPA: hypothetical protein VGE67_05185 [Haloferula sp.]
MKTKSSVLALVAASALLHAAPMEIRLSPEDQAKMKVSTEIYSKVNTYSGRFSRVGPIPSHRLEFQPQMLVKEEPRLPFTITPARNQKVMPQLQGYIRLSDQQVFLLDLKTGNYRPATEDPRFTPALPPSPKVVPAKPL